VPLFAASVKPRALPSAALGAKVAGKTQEPK